MRFTFNWLKRYLSTNWDVYQISQKLTAIGLEVEKLENPSDIFKNFKLVQIESVEAHHNADKLKICVVKDAAEQRFKIVCGAKNAIPGLKTVLAMSGAVIPSTNKTLKKSKIRGVESEGMLCSCDELGIQSDNDGIINIGADIDLINSVGDALGYGGGIFELAITPNRGDCFSVKGIARDLAAAGAGKFIDSPEIVCKSSFAFPIKIKYEKSDAYCKYAPFIAFRVIRGIKNKESPDWLKALLKSAGINSISAVVDLSNLWLMDSGRPIHIYDLNKIDGDLNLRFAKAKEKFIDLKGNEHVLHQDMLVAADEKEPLCLFGIMGGLKSACDSDTTDVLIESGLFDPIFISRTGAFLNITSDSRMRFERGIDKNSCISGLESISKAIISNCGGIASDICTIGTSPEINRNVLLRKNRLNSVAGIDIDWEEAKKILQNLGLEEVNSFEDQSTFLIPSWRSDLNIEEDLVEEILRIAGYDNINAKRIDWFVDKEDPILKAKRNVTAIKRLLASCGLSEIISYSFMKSEYAEVFKEENKLLHLLNPISEDFSVMRPSLIPSLILAAERSIRYGQPNVELFECGNVFLNSCQQEFHISGFRMGKHVRSWLGDSRDFDIFDSKGDIFSILSYFGITEKDTNIKTEVPSYYHPSRSGSIFYGNKKLGYFGELHPKINKIFSIDETMVCFEFINTELDTAPKNYNYNTKVFPKINRDFAFIFDSKITVGNLINGIYKIDDRILRAYIFDCFDMSKEKKSIGFSIMLGAFDRTLTEIEAVEVSNKVIKYIESAGGELRKK